ncbi:hypothetical protein HOLleu_23822 [Holothuria leucospilota]|uniref:LRAT domain-containing protein n=1 Tax=Holothuria leucospilota TaxID=206669 RepID=A0A9Q1BVS6_HOLLE|nr:hypothetical protein HOLleu_23822 [Holothuria leucospilota]
MKCKANDCELEYYISDCSKDPPPDVSISYQGKIFFMKTPVQRSEFHYSDKTVQLISELEEGDHIVWKMWQSFYHHAIVVEIIGDTQLSVIHWTNNSSSSNLSSSGNAKGILVCETIDFKKKYFKRVNHVYKENRKVVVARAFHMLENENKPYSVTENNCESFAMYCTRGIFHSVQGTVAKKVLTFPLQALA